MSDQENRYKQLPSGERPDDLDTELRAFAFGTCTTAPEYTAVRIQQAVEIMGVRILVYSELDPKRARDFAAALIERAEIVEGTRTDVTY